MQIGQRWLLREFVSRMEYIFPKLANEKEVRILKRKVENGK